MFSAGGVPDLVGLGRGSRSTSVYDAQIQGGGRYSGPSGRLQMPLIALRNPDYACVRSVTWGQAPVHPAGFGGARVEHGYGAQEGGGAGRGAQEASPHQAAAQGEPVRVGPTWRRKVGARNPAKELSSRMLPRPHGALRHRTRALTIPWCFVKPSTPVHQELAEYTAS